LTVTGTAPAGTNPNTYVYAIDDFSFRAKETLGSPDNNLFVGVLGNHDVPIERVFSGAVIAPNSSLYISDVGAGVHTGQFFGKNIEVRSAGSIRLKPFPAIWDNADECKWEGATEGQACAYDIACPGSYQRKCVQNTCTCVTDTMGNPSQDQCSYVKANSNVLGYAVAGTACTASYGSSCTCDGVGYCHCSTGSPPVGDCTESDPYTPGTTRPVKDGTVCSTYAGTCTVTPSCGGGTCSCNAPVVPVGKSADCLIYPAGTSCIGYDCLDGTCNNSGGCDCPELPAMTQGHPIRIGTQNTAAMPTFETWLFDKLRGVSNRFAHKPWREFDRLALA
jgi:hypothetical protein